MDKELEKNRLDLAYQRQLHYLNGVIALGTIGILTFLSTFIWNKEKLSIGFLILIILILISYFWHNNIDRNIKEISNKIKYLK